MIQPKVVGTASTFLIDIANSYKPVVKPAAISYDPRLAKRAPHSIPQECEPREGGMLVPLTVGLCLIG